MNGPLNDIVVLDATRILAGPFCTMLLADLGARVVKVEAPLKGDIARRIGPLNGDDAAYFMSVNRGKESVTLDLFSQQGQKLFRELSRHADVVVENYLPGTMQSIGLEYSDLQKINPQLIYASISGFGQDGPYASRPALDIIIQAMGGLMSITGKPDGPPLRPGASLGDSIAGLFTALAITAALYDRKQTGQGQFIDMAMLDCQVTMMENALSRYFATSQIPERMGSRHPAAFPFQDFAVSDGYIVVGLLTDNPEIWRRFCQAINLPQLADDPRFTDNQGRMANKEILEQFLIARFTEQTMAYWMKRLKDESIPCAPIQNMAEVAVDPQVLHRGMIKEIPHPSLGTWRVANTPFRFSDLKSGVQGIPPTLGQHTENILKEWLGLSTEAIKSFRTSGII